jgi:threonylcarbamoyladenosine tRNA methylthiotransferase MtaB
MKTSPANATTVAIETLGCKLNQAESEAMALQFAENGYRLVSPSDAADIYILNTCTVTGVADRKSRYFLRLARRRNPDAAIVALGCYPDRNAKELERLKCADMILGNDAKDKLPSILELNHQRLPGGASAGDVLRTRSMVKIQEGCDHFCSYCIVPYVRGRERSRNADEIIADIESRIDLGFKEIVLTGTNIGSYKPNLESLIKRILYETEVQRLRLSSLRPGDISNGLLELWNDARLCRHLHLPLQIGSETVLRRMNRPYNIADYESAIIRIRKMIPNVSITADVIVGFPGETDEEFEQSYNFCRDMSFANLHVFSYSQRPGTAAAAMPRQVDERIKKERSNKMLKLARESALRFGRRFKDETLPVLWETEVAPGVWDGLTDNYIRVMTRSSKSLKNKIVDATLSDVYNKSFKCIETSLIT